MNANSIMTDSQLLYLVYIISNKNLKPYWPPKKLHFLDLAMILHCQVSCYANIINVYDIFIKFVGPNQAFVVTASGSQIFLEFKNNS